MNFYFSHCESDQLLAKAVKCRLLAQATAGKEAARALTALADAYQIKAHLAEAGCPELEAEAARRRG